MVRLQNGIPQRIANPILQQQGLTQLISLFLDDCMAKLESPFSLIKECVVMSQCYQHEKSLGGCLIIVIIIFLKEDVYSFNSLCPKNGIFYTRWMTYALQSDYKLHF